MINYGAPQKDGPLEKVLGGRIPYRSLQVVNTMLFTLKTGLMQAPTTLLTDATMRPELVYAGLMDPKIMKMFEQAVRGGVAEATDPFLRGRNPELVSVPEPVSRRHKAGGTSGNRVAARQGQR